MFFYRVFSVIILPLHHCDLHLNIFAISAHNKQPTSRTNTQTWTWKESFLIVFFVCVILLTLNHPPTLLPIHIAKTLMSRGYVCENMGNIPNPIKSYFIMSIVSIPQNTWGRWIKTRKINTQSISTPPKLSYNTIKHTLSMNPVHIANISTFVQRYTEITLK